MLKRGNLWLKTGAGVGILAILANVGVLIWAARAHTVHPSGTIGYGDIVVGAGTLILAIVTLGSVVLGWLALGDTRRELEATQRPVVVPIATNELVDSPDPRYERISARPTSVGGALLVPIRNIGAGPAMSVTVIVVVRTRSGELSKKWGTYMYHGYAYAIAVGESVAPLVVIDDLVEIPTFDLRVAFRDLTGRNWVTSATYSRAGDGGSAGMYYDPRIEPLPVAGDPGNYLLAEQRRVEQVMQDLNREEN